MSTTEVQRLQQARVFLERLCKIADCFCSSLGEISSQNPSNSFFFFPWYVSTKVSCCVQILWFSYILVKEKKKKNISRMVQNICISSFKPILVLQDRKVYYQARPVQEDWAGDCWVLIPVCLFVFLCLVLGNSEADRSFFMKGWDYGQGWLSPKDYKRCKRLTYRCIIRTCFYILLKWHDVPWTQWAHFGNMKKSFLRCLGCSWSKVSCMSRVSGKQNNSCSMDWARQNMKNINNLLILHMKSLGASCPSQLTYPHYAAVPSTMVVVSPMLFVTILSFSHLARIEFS